MTIQDIKDAARAMRGMADVTLASPRLRSGIFASRSGTEDLVDICFGGIGASRFRETWFEVFENASGAWQVLGTGEEYTDAVRMLLDLKQRAEAREAAFRLGAG